MKNIAIIAGNGILPFEVARLLLKRNYHCHLFGIEGEVGDEILQFSHSFISFGQLSKLVKLLRHYEMCDILLLGGVRRRPNIWNFIWQLKPDFGLLKILPRLLKMLSMGDNSLLKQSINWFEENGFKVHKLSDIAPELLIGKNETFGKSPNSGDYRRLLHGAKVIKTLSEYDIGQGAVVVGERVVAIEGIEGTDEMLQRIKHLRIEGRLPSKGGVLVKCKKTAQDERADLPSVGPQTIENIYQAGLTGLGVEAGYTIIMQRDVVLSLLKKYNLFIYGLSDNEKEKI